MSGLPHTGINVQVQIYTLQTLNNGVIVGSGFNLDPALNNDSAQYTVCNGNKTFALAVSPGTAVFLTVNISFSGLNNSVTGYASAGMILS